jgi:hypothetical protein
MDRDVNGRWIYHPRGRATIMTRYGMRKMKKFLITTSEADP